MFKTCCRIPVKCGLQASRRGLNVIYVSQAEHEAKHSAKADDSQNPWRLIDRSDSLEKIPAVT